MSGDDLHECIKHSPLVPQKKNLKKSIISYRLVPKSKKKKNNKENRNHFENLNIIWKEKKISISSSITQWIDDDDDDDDDHDDEEKKWFFLFLYFFFFNFNLNLL